MLNGKFYTGLTANQLNRSRGPDRQRSSFFWPDETDSVPPSPRRNTRQSINRNSVERSTPERPSQERDINPKELFHKQLTSKIEFNDPEPSPKRNNTTAKQNISYRQNTSQNNESFSKPDTFTSKIEFYDYAEESPKTSTPIRTQNNGDNLNTSPRNIADRKKITFDDKYSTKKGILKNNETPRGRPDASPIKQLPNYKKNIVPRQNLSKSVENISKLDLNGDYKKKESTAEVNSPQPSVTHRREQHHAEESYYSEKINDSAPKIVQKNSIRNDYNYQDKNGSYSHHEESYNDYNNQHYERRSEQQKINNRSYNDYNTNRNNSRQHNEDSYKDNSQRTKYIPIQVNNSPSRKEYSSPSKNDRREERSSTPKYGSTNRESHHQYPNEAAGRAHTHLRSNIFFNDDTHYNDERPRSIRESAVNRVGVGLPNI